jgi:hypothetical protein
MATHLRIVDLEDNTRDIRVIAADLIAFEQKFELAATKIESFYHMCWLAWKADSRAKTTALDFDQWILNIDSITDTEDPKVT